MSSITSMNSSDPITGTTLSTFFQQECMSPTRQRPPFVLRRALNPCEYLQSYSTWLSWQSFMRYFIKCLGRIWLNDIYILFIIYSLINLLKGFQHICHIFPVLGFFPHRFFSLPYTLSTTIVSILLSPHLVLLAPVNSCELHNYYLALSFLLMTLCSSSGLSTDAFFLIKRI